MATLSAWLSVLVRRGQEVVKPRTVVKCSWEDTFGSLLDKLDMTQVSIEKIQIAAHEKFTDPVDLHVVPIDAPVIICDQFKCMHVCITIESMEAIHASERRPNAFDVLMASSRDVVLPPKLSPPDGKELRRDQQLYKKRKALLVCGKVRCTITCGECHKPRCVYSMSKLTAQEASHVAVVEDSNLYTCGASLFPPGSDYEMTIVVRAALVCSMHIESQYYSSVLIHFPPVCYYCGQGEEALIDNEEIKELKASYAVVYPICFLCHSEGKQPHCKQPSNVAKRRKT